jgi:TonB family protein
VVISVLVHAVAGLAAVAYSFWHIEEVTPARVTVTFISAASLPVPPPPPPPLASGAAASAAPKHRPAARLKTDPTPVLVPDKIKPTPVIEAPPAVVETPHAAPAGDPAGKTGAGEGTATGEGIGKGPKGPGTTPCNGPNCSATGIPGATGAPKFLPPQMGAKLKVSGADPDFPAFLRQRSGTNYMVLAKICVAASGAVDGVTLLKRADPTLDNNVLSAVKAWRYQPMTANGMPVPFCYVMRFEFKSE